MNKLDGLLQESKQSLLMITKQLKASRMSSSAYNSAVYGHDMDPLSNGDIITSKRNTTLNAPEESREMMRLNSGVMNLNIYLDGQESDGLGLKKLTKEALENRAILQSAVDITQDNSKSLRSMDLDVKARSVDEQIMGTSGDMKTRELRFCKPRFWIGNHV